MAKGAPKGNKNHFKYGFSHTSLDNIYKAMISRCYKPRNNRYSIYGGRGIKVCDEWLSNKISFFTWAFNSGYHDGLSIDRINPDGNYSPDNCRWATYKEQQNNRRNNIRITVDGVTHTVPEWAEIINVKADTLRPHVKRGNAEKYIMERL